MSERIKILDDLVVNQIAAGEVVERPASVVKELLENALDAQSSHISISILNGGLSHIEILDDGIGMSKMDLVKCIERFGTSKVNTSEDLFNITTYGFRGEALPSIASVSKLSIQTRERDESDAFNLKIEGGSDPEIFTTAAPEGTKIKVENLFFNVPARRKFLKSERSEANSIKSVISDFSLARPEVGFLFYEEGKEIFSYPTGQSLLQRVKHTKLVQGVPVELNFERSYDSDSTLTSLGIQNDSRLNRISVKGYISQPLFAARVGSKIRFLVNGRIIKSPLLVRAVRDGFGSFLKPGFYPTGVVAITLPPRDLDVNVHPQKTEVRFRFESLIFSSIREAVSSALSLASESLPKEKVYQLNVPSFKDQKANISKQSEIEFIGKGRIFKDDLVYLKSDNQNGETSLSLAENLIAYEGAYSPSSLSVSEPQYRSEVGNDSSVQDHVLEYSKLRYLGQIFKLYLLFEGKNNFAVVDMHAAHERITFFQLKKAFRKREIIKQSLLIPISIEISAFDDPDSIVFKLDALDAFGIEAEVRDSEVLIRSIPSILSQDHVSDMIKNLLPDLPDVGFEKIIEEKEDSYLARLACHNSLRRGRQISSDEAYALMEQLETTDLSGWCPHGRPVIWWINEKDLESRFGRIASGLN